MTDAEVRAEYAKEHERISAEVEQEQQTEERKTRLTQVALILGGALGVALLMRYARRANERW